MTDSIPGGQNDQPHDAVELPPWNALTDLYVSGAMSPSYQSFGLLASAWLRELPRTVPYTYGRKVAGEVSYPPDYDQAPYVKTFRLQRGQVLTLKLRAYREYPRDDGRWFERVEIRDHTSRTDKAALAGLSVLEGSGVRGEGIDRIHQRLLGEQVYLRTEEDKLLAFARALLLHHRPDIDQASDEGVEVLVGVCHRVAELAINARRLADFLEYGSGGRDTRPNVEDAQTDIYAAELHYIAGMSQREVATKLRLPVSVRDKEKGGHATAASRIERGKGLFVRALGGEDEWRRYVKLLRDQYESR